MTDAKSKSLKWDLLASYAAAAARVISWAVVFALVYRYDSPESAGLLIAARSILAFVPVAMLNIPTAFLWRLSIPVAEDASKAQTSQSLGTLSYATPHKGENRWNNDLQTYIHSTRIMLPSLVLIPIAVFIVMSIAMMRETNFGESLSVILILAVGTVLRTLSDLSAVVIQRRGYLLRDQLLLLFMDVVFVLLSCIYFSEDTENRCFAVSCVWMVTSLLLLFVRWYSASSLLSMPNRGRLEWSLSEMLPLARYGFSVSVGQVADLLYAPLTLLMLWGSLWLVGQSLDSERIAYAILLQIDAALLLAVTAITAVLTPRLSVDLSRTRIIHVQKVLWQGTLWAALVLFALAGVLLIASEPLLEWWLDDVPGMVFTVLPVFLLHTVVGGASGVMRSFLLISGESRAVTKSALIAGVCNAAGVACVLMLTNWGLLGVACVTAVCVMARCGVWMPWYTNKTLRKLAAAGAKIETDSGGEISAADGVIALPQEARGLP